MTPAVYTSVLLLAAAVMQVAAMGPCHNDVVERILADNSENCLNNITGQLYTALGEIPQFDYRVSTQAITSLFSCGTAVMEEPENNNVLLRFKGTFRDESLGDLYVNFTSVEASCGLFFKYIVEESHVFFKVTIGYIDENSIGYYGCSSEPNSFYDENDMYIVCIAPHRDTPEVDASLAKCKERMELVTGVELQTIPFCDNDNKYLPIELAKKASS